MAKTQTTRLGASDLKRRVGENLALAREALGWNQARLALEYKRIGVTSPKLSQWENGKYFPDPYFLVHFCDDRGFTMDWFYRGTRAGVSVARADDLQRAAAGKSAA